MKLKEKFIGETLLTETEVQNLIWNQGDEESGISLEAIQETDSGRWMSYNDAIFEMDGRFYKVEYEQGLTECQENYYPTQVAQRVAKKNVVKLVTEYLPYGEDDEDEE